MKKITRYPVTIAGSEKESAYTLVLAHEKMKDFALLKGSTLYANLSPKENPYGSYIVELSLQSHKEEDSFYQNTNELTELTRIQIEEYLGMNKTSRLESENKESTNYRNHYLQATKKSIRQSFDFPFLLRGTEFQISVWKELCRIPYGETRSYSQIAEAIGNPKACRAVGGANNKNPISIAVPCHRVIGANGNLVGYGLGLGLKQVLLEWEAKNKDR